MFLCCAIKIRLKWGRMSDIKGFFLAHTYNAAYLCTAHTHSSSKYCEFFFLRLLLHEI